MPSGSPRGGGSTNLPPEKKKSETSTKNSKRIAIASDFLSQEKSQGSLGMQDTFGTRKIAAIFSPASKNCNCYVACSPEEFCEYLFRVCLGILHWKMAGIFGDFFLVSSPTKRSTKSPRKIRGKFGAKFGTKFGPKIRKIRETFVLQLSWPNNCACRKIATLGALRSSPTFRKRQRPGNQGFKKSAEIGDVPSTPLWLHRSTVKQVFWELSCPRKEEFQKSDNFWTLDFRVFCCFLKPGCFKPGCL